VATLKSVSRAAEKLFLTQSAMSARIAALEEELGVLLLDRRKKQFHLTVPGTTFFAYAQRLLALQKEVRAAVGNHTTQAIHLRLGAIESVLHSWLIPWIEQFRSEHPALEFELTVETTPVLAEQVSRGILDLVFAALPSSGDGVRVMALPPMEMVFVGNSTIHTKRRYSIEELAQYELLTFQRGSQPHVALLDLLKRSGVEAKRVHAISSISAMLQLVQSGFGIATLPKAAVERVQTVQNIKLLNCELKLGALPLHASYRDDPSYGLVELALASALNFVQKPSVSKKSMKA
jgi:DNA-binding transcriptional LysR family regulator